VLYLSSRPIRHDSLGHSEPCTINEAEGIELTVRVENRSYFAVRITEAGLGSRKFKLRYQDIIGVRTTTPMIEARDHHKWSLLIFVRQPNESGTFVGKALIDEATFAYVKTVTGDTFCGCRKDVKKLRQLVDALCNRPA